MQSNNTTIRRVGTFGVAITLGLFLLGGTASAAPKAERGKGPDQTTTVTEDNDTNDGTGNNVVDEGDNAHPSGNDRSVEHGGSGNQGKAKADPDDDDHGPVRTNGGIDQPGGAGGVDSADQDGNNGCGNDDDFEDDNNGWCGRKPAASEPTVDQVPPAVVPEVEPTPAATVTVVEVIATAVVPAPADTATTKTEVASAAAVREVPTQVLGVTQERVQTERPTEVLGVSFERGTLARTGFNITTLLLVAVALVVIGMGCKRATRRS